MYICIHMIMKHRSATVYRQEESDRNHPYPPWKWRAPPPRSQSWPISQPLKTLALNKNPDSTFLLLRHSQASKKDSLRSPNGLETLLFLDLLELSFPSSLSSLLWSLVLGKCSSGRLTYIHTFSKDSIYSTCYSILFLRVSTYRESVKLISLVFSVGLTRITYYYLITCVRGSNG